VIVTFSFEEIQALRQGARAVLDRDVDSAGVAVAAPPEERVRVERLIARLNGHLSMGTLAEQRRTQAAVSTIARVLLDRMHREIDASHPAAEPAVAAYFEYAHARTVLQRVRDIGGHMTALIEVVTGSPPDDLVAETFAFPD
jgi:hypothetical protein